MVSTQNKSEKIFHIWTHIPNPYWSRHAPIFRLLLHEKLYYQLCMFLFSETPIDVRSGDTVFAVYSYIAETDEAINLVEGERLYILGK